MSGTLFTALFSVFAQNEEERLQTVERDNRILLERMSHIMKTKGAVDNKNDYEHKSLSKERRQHELKKITAENQAILKRIQNAGPTMKTKSMVTRKDRKKETRKRKEKEQHYSRNRDS